MFKTGDRVEVQIPITELTASNAMKALSGTRTVVDGVRNYLMSTMRHTYTLEGCVAKNQIQYEFFEEWLIPLEESEGSNG